MKSSTWAHAPRAQILADRQFSQGFSLVPGCVRFLHPAFLEEAGGVTIASAAFRVIAPHPFVLSLSVAGVGALLPLFSRGGDGRIEVPSAVRFGHHGWVRRPCFLHPGQVWLAPEAAIDAAAEAAGDLSNTEHPNSIAPTWLHRALARAKLTKEFQ